MARIGLLALCLTLAAHAAPPGFDNATINQLRTGKVLVEDSMPTNKSLLVRVRAFYPNATPESFVSLVTDHENLPNLAPEIKKGTTTFVSEDRSEFHYAIEGSIRVPIAGDVDFNPEGIQLISRNLAGATRIENTITNYKDDVDSGVENTLLWPFENGFLEDTVVDVKLKKTIPFSGVVRRKVREASVAIVEKIREEITP